MEAGDPSPIADQDECCVEGIVTAVKPAKYDKIKLLVQNTWTHPNRTQLPMGICYKKGNHELQIVNPTDPGGYTMQNADKMFGIICATHSIDATFQADFSFASEKYVVKTTLEVRRKNATKESLYVADQEDVDKEGAERRSRLAVLYCLLREEEIRECVFEMRNYLDAQKEKNSAEEYACLLPAGPHPWRLSEEDAICFYDSCITSPVFEERNAVIRSFFVLVVQNSLNPFTLGTTISKLLINHATVQTINYEDRYSNLLIISEASPQKYRIVLNERSRSDLLAFINRTK